MKRVKFQIRDIEKNLSVSSEKLIEKPVFYEFNHTFDKFLGCISSVGIGVVGATSYLDIEIEFEDNHLVNYIENIGFDKFELRPSYMRLGDINILTSVSLCCKKEETVKENVKERTFL